MAGRNGGNGAAPEGGRLMSIGDLAAITGVSRRTIRYYEELGILPEPPRSPGGTRKYPEEYRFYIEGALALKQVGFNLDEVRLIGRLALGARLKAAERSQAVRAIGEKRQALEHKIRVLNRINKLLDEEEESLSSKGRSTPRSSQTFAEILA